MCGHATNFREGKARFYWITQTGAGGAILTAALLGFFIGLAVVSQSIYATTMEEISRRFCHAEGAGGFQRFHPPRHSQPSASVRGGRVPVGTAGNQPDDTRGPSQHTLGFGPRLASAGDCDTHRRHVYFRIHYFSKSRDVGRTGQGVPCLTLILTARNVGMSYGSGSTRVRGAGRTAISLSFAPGTLNLIMGPSGSGKTTLLCLCSGCLLTPDAGSVFVDGTRKLRTLDEREADRPAQRADRFYISGVPAFPFFIGLRECHDCGGNWREFAISRVQKQLSPESARETGG